MSFSGWIRAEGISGGLTAGASFEKAFATPRTLDMTGPHLPCTPMPLDFGYS
jgi:hypothetical protein